MSQHFKLIKQSLLAVILIGLGVIGKLYIPNQYVSSFLFAFGLFSICKLNGSLFTGKCGYAFSNLQNFYNTLFILLYNTLFGYLFGLLISMAYPDLILIANNIVFNWGISLSYFIKAIFCGMVMFIAVDINKKNSALGIFYGIPLFLLAGFQHSIANIIIMGASQSINIVPYLICVFGNWIGSIIIYYIVY